MVQSFERDFEDFSLPGKIRVDSSVSSASGNALFGLFLCRVWWPNIQHIDEASGANAHAFTFARTATSAVAKSPAPVSLSTSAA